MITAMAYLSYPSAAEVQLRLEAQEGPVLAVIRGCPWWTKADVEGRLPGSSTASSVSLTTTRALEATLRRILEMSFGIVFPPEGGAGTPPKYEAPRTRGTKRRATR